jgi:hypothetical protein
MYLNYGTGLTPRAPLHGASMGRSVVYTRASYDCAFCCSLIALVCREYSREVVGKKLTSLQTPGKPIVRLKHRITGLYDPTGGSICAYLAEDEVDVYNGLFPHSQLGQPSPLLCLTAA